MKYFSKIWRYATSSIARTISTIMFLLVTWIILLNVSIKLEVPDVYIILGWLPFLLVGVVLVRNIKIKIEKEDKK